MSQAEHDRRVDYVEFRATDPQAVRRFYETVFGWKFTDYGPDYTSFEDGRLSGGFARSEERPASGGALVVIYAADLDATRKRVEEAGVRTYNEHSFPGGRRFHFTDPGGNELAVWSER